jgi:hypothetical protein
VKRKRSLLQIVPRAPGGHDGVGDYAQSLARKLRQHHSFETTFVAGTHSSVIETSDGFRIRSPLRHFEAGPPDPIILHYGNYGYDPRGIPLWLPRVLHNLKSSAPLLTIYHELYARGSWRQSAFWLRPLQMRLARSIARLSDRAMVSSEVWRDQLLRLAPETRVIVHPVISNFGEPELTPEAIAVRDPHRWIICGRSELLERSLHSFLRIADRIETGCAPRELFVIGGAENAATRETLREQKKIKTHYHPAVKASFASEILARCAFGWLDYFVHSDIPVPAILKSSSFAAFCAHGVIPVSPQSGAAIALGGDALPGPFFVSSSGQKLPSASERALVAQSIYSWYQRHACSAHLAATVAAALADEGSSS